MFCPQCGQERHSTETSFCSRCGFLLTGAAELLLTGGLLPRPERPAGGMSARSKGIRKGLFIFLLAVVFVPLFALITLVSGMREPVLPVLALILLVGGGLLRMAYALLFESAAPVGGSAPVELSGARSAGALSGSSQIPADAYSPPAGSWRNTNELQPRSVTEGTTKLLERDE